MRFITRTRLRWLTKRQLQRLGSRDSGRPGLAGQDPRGRQVAQQCSITVKAPAWLSPNQPGMGLPTAPVRKQRPLTGIRVRRFFR
ncbi:hypothetical protein [Megalodesulfovibrio paquesii]